MNRIYSPLKLQQKFSLISFLVFLLTFSNSSAQNIDNQLLINDSRFSPTLQNRLKSKHKDSFNIYVQVNDEAVFQAWLEKKLPKLKILAKHLAGRVFTLQVNNVDFKELINCKSITYFDLATRKAQAERDLGNLDLSANHILALHTLFPHLHGLGTKVSIKEKPFDTTDVDLRGRIILNNQFDELATFHATAMATIIGGAGNSAPNGRGVAWQSQMTTSDFEVLMPDNPQLLINQGIYLQNHSYGVGIENFYGLESQAYDQDSYQNPSLLHIFSSGNRGDSASRSGVYQQIKGFANLTGQFKMSKNTLSIGSADSLGKVTPRSSRGPAYDGRVKPEILAYGDGGSSDAAAIASGTALILQQLYQTKYTQKPSSDLLRAILINSADDKGRPEVDFEHGFGSLDALGAVRTLEEGRFWQQTIQANQTLNFPLQIPTGVKKVKITLAWNDPAATANSIKALVNDLDISLLHTASNQTYLPWVLNAFPHLDSLKKNAQRGIDRLNNVEQITLDLPTGGSYQISVNGFQVSGNQSFSLVYEFEQGFEWMHPLVDSKLWSGKINAIRWQNYTNSKQGKLEYKMLSEQNWTLINANVDLDNSYFAWMTPAKYGLAQIRLTIDNQVLTSSTFILSPEFNLKISNNCPEELLLNWSPIPDVSDYQIYMLKDKYLEPILITTDTLVLINKNDFKSNYFALAPRFNEQKGANSKIASFLGLNIGCYIKSFLPELAVNDVATLQLELSSLYQIKQIELEKLSPSGFQTILSINSPTKLNFTLTDEKPDLGENIYRIKLTTDNQRLIYSQNEAIIFARPSEVLYYPNPIKSGENLNVIFSKDEEIIIKWFDCNGRLITELSEIGAIKVFDLSRFSSGIYFMEISNAQGLRFRKKLIVL
jgi:hypothetical protein